MTLTPEALATWIDGLPVPIPFDLEDSLPDHWTQDADGSDE